MPRFISLQQSLLVAMPLVRLAVFMCLLLPATGRGQRADGRIVRGIVRDTAGKSIPDAEVALRPNHLTRTDSGGRFVFLCVEGGTVRITAKARGFVAETVDARVVARDTVDVLLVLRSIAAQPLPTVAVEAARRSAVPGFALASSTPPASSLIREGPSGSGCSMPKACYFQVFLDGARLYSMTIGSLPPQADRFRANVLEAVEVYYGGSDVPPQYGGTGAACGTVLIWTRR